MKEGFEYCYYEGGDLTQHWFYTEPGRDCERLRWTQRKTVLFIGGVGVFVALEFVLTYIFNYTEACTRLRHHGLEARL